ncbi:MAG: transglycosylase SLT domain-containing protein [Thermodesulfovibrionales bacterium]
MKKRGLPVLICICLAFLMIADCSRKKEDIPLPAGEQGGETLVSRLREPWTGDLDEILRQRRAVRVLVYYSKTNFAVVEGRPQGLDYELLHNYENFLDWKGGRRKEKPLVVFIPVPREQIIPMLLEGRGDIAAGLTSTPQGEKLVAFTGPYITDVREVVVTGKWVSGLRSLGDLAGRTVHIVAGSSYAEHLRELNKRFREERHRSINIVEADKVLEAEDIFEMVNSGIFPITVVDQHIADLWACVLPGIVVRKDIVVARGANIAWAVRKGNPQLLASLDGFIKAKAGQGSILNNLLFTRYYGNTKWIRNPIAESEKLKLVKYQSYIKKYANMYGFDWLKIAAMAYRESQLDQNVRSRTGAVGVLQVLPRTAREVGIRNVARAEDNIHAGVKYLNYLRETYFNDPAISPDDKVDFALAAYNAGPARIESLRRKAADKGLNPNKWFFNVERVALQVIGSETVQYVADIYKYFIAYKSAETIIREKRIKMQKAGKDS